MYELMVEGASLKKWSFSIYYYKKTIKCRRGRNSKDRKHVISEKQQFEKHKYKINLDEYQRDSRETINEEKPVSKNVKKLSHILQIIKRTANMVFSK